MCNPPSIVEKLGLPKKLQYIESTRPKVNELPCIAFRPAPPELVMRFQRLREGKKERYSNQPETKGNEEADNVLHKDGKCGKVDCPSDKAQVKQEGRRKVKGYLQSTSNRTGPEGRQTAKKMTPKRSHVSTCTCAACKKRRRNAAQRPTKLKYQMHGPMIAVVRATFAEQGFVMSNKDDWNVLWTSRCVQAGSIST